MLKRIIKLMKAYKRFNFNNYKIDYCPTLIKDEKWASNLHEKCSVIETFSQKCRFALWSVLLRMIVLPGIHQKGRLATCKMIMVWLYQIENGVIFLSVTNDQIFGSYRLEPACCKCIAGNIEWPFLSTNPTFNEDIWGK